MQADSSLIRTIVPSDDVKKATLSGSIRADQTYDLSVLYCEGDIVEYRESPKA
jgi:hypothetical protein